MSPILLLQASASDCLIISFALTCLCLSDRHPCGMLCLGEDTMDFKSYTPAQPSFLHTPLRRPAVAPQPSTLADTPGGAETPGTKIRNKGVFRAGHS